jgi:D-alanyl-D-alanine carboxypeptidase/D-alanyl-D-alanine-endopeptidase (penicillin-binding protein 4)
MKFGELTLENGAGLSRESRITARHMTELLRYAYGSPYMPEYLSSMALSGMDGTLTRRLGDSRLRGNAHLKTGSLDHVSGIAGYVLGSSTDRYSVVVFVNHTDAHRGTGDEVQEAVLNWVRDQ